MRPRNLLIGLIVLFILITLQNKNRQASKDNNFKETIDTSQFTNFTHWCLNREQVKPSTRNMIDALLHKVDTTDCNIAETRLHSLVSISITSFSEGKRKPLDLRPLRSLTQLIGLSIFDSDVSDIRSLQNLTNLESLDLGDDKITDITSLQYLTELEELKLGQNNISDISPIVSLKKLKYLVLSGNKITDISPLKFLTRLDTVYLNDNSIINENCPLERKSVCIFFLPK